MQATISKWGNSLAVRLPRQVAEQAKLAEGTTVELTVAADGSVQIAPMRKKLKLADLLEGEAALAAGAPSRETDWGPARGSEEW